MPVTLVWLIFAVHARKAGLDGREFDNRGIRHVNKGYRDEPRENDP
jgi:hypothetical protein